MEENFGTQRFHSHFFQKYSRGWYLKRKIYPLPQVQEGHLVKGERVLAWATIEKINHKMPKTCARTFKSH